MRPAGWFSLVAACALACSENPPAPVVDAAPLDGPLDTRPADAPLAADAALALDAAPATDAAPASDAPGPASCQAAGAGSRFAEWPLPDPTTTGAPRSQRYDLADPEVAVDQVTGLVWQRQLDPGVHDWRSAQQHCACLRLGGHADWRLPTRIELVSIVDYTKDHAAIDRVAFPATPSEWFWTASEMVDLPGFAWYLYFETGFSNFIDQESTYRVRCVRAPTAPAPPPARYTVGADTVRDVATGLEWQRRVDGIMRSWAEANAYCAGLALAGGGWRLPNMKELQSLIDDRRASPAIDGESFPDTASEPHWTGTPVSGTPGSAWRVSFEHGYTYDADMKYEYLARCVR
jgi:hypothetical protein